jgi:hypothetical protein
MIGSGGTEGSDGSGLEAIIVLLFSELTFQGSVKLENFIGTYTKKLRKILDHITDYYNFSFIGKRNIK